MKTIGITMEIRNDISAVAEDGESVNDTLIRLLNKEDIAPFQPNPRTNINISEDVFEQLNELKDNPKESYGSVIMRLIQSQK